MRCDKCKREMPAKGLGANFTEIYEPKSGSRYTQWLCDDCQSEMCRMVGRWLGGQ